jgi:adenosylcobinamide kinase/adenosylcobinamide-phosphate guanylyltransferase
MFTLVTGPVRSGKSRFALELARESGRVPLFVATAEIDPADREMTDRVARHRAERGAMRTIETSESRGPRLVDVLAAVDPGEIAIVDSLGTWLGSRLVALAGPHGVDVLAAGEIIDRESAALVAALDALRADAIVVAEETGWGVVPPSALGRAFRDALGRLTATLAGRAGHAYLVVAGYAVDLHAAGRRVSDR